MDITPKIKGFICTTAHEGGCRQNVLEQINYIKSSDRLNGANERRFTNVLVIGSSGGYGLSSLICAAFGDGARTVGVSFEREGDEARGRTASAGLYNMRAVADFAREGGLYFSHVNGDAFSPDTKRQVLDTIARDMGKIDLVVYSLAAPSRVDYATGEKFSSVIKPIGKEFCGTTIDTNTGKLSTVTVQSATEAEVAATVKVMGGDDWQQWILALHSEGLLAHDYTTVAYSYIGPALTHDIYTNGTIGAAKRDLERARAEIERDFGGRALISVNKALVTQASAAIPVVPLYISILYSVMKQKGIHEGCIEQMARMWRVIGIAKSAETDAANAIIRLDDLEMRPDVQQEVMCRWGTLTQENLHELCDLDGYKSDFLKIFGFASQELGVR